MVSGYVQAASTVTEHHLLDPTEELVTHTWNLVANDPKVLEALNKYSQEMVRGLQLEENEMTVLFSKFNDIFLTKLFSRLHRDSFTNIIAHNGR